ncbi:hypothetical protein EON65_57105 [archaeon]|nr:MAG: hypothetical protein EON65_57105 [archaeon]
MSSAIGRAGKQVFTALEHGQVVGAAKPPHKPEPPPNNPALGVGTISSSHISTYRQTTTERSTELSINNARRRSDSADTDLDDTLAQLQLLDNHSGPSSSSLSPIKEADSPIPPSFLAKHPNQSRQLSQSSSEPSAAQDKSSVSIKQLAEETLAFAGMDKNIKVADMEKEQLLAALQVLKMQNQMLTHKIEVDKQENQLKMDYERKARMAAVSVLEQENQHLLRQLTESKNEAESKLQEEKRKFEATLLAIDQEKKKLQVQVHQLQKDSEKEISKLVQERDSIEKQATELEREKDKMYNQVCECVYV